MTHQDRFRANQMSRFTAVLAVIFVSFLWAVSHSIAIIDQDFPDNHFSTKKEDK